MMRMLAGFLALAALAVATANAEEKLEEPLSCITLTQLDRTVVVNDRMVLFYMKGKEVYLNNLQHDCPALRAENRFMYRVSANRLCDMDAITVLQDFGFGFIQGPSCGLGKFEPISPEVAKKLRKSGGL